MFVLVNAPLPHHIFMDAKNEPFPQTSSAVNTENDLIHVAKGNHSSIFNKLSELLLIGDENALIHRPTSQGGNSGSSSDASPTASIATGIDSTFR